MMTESDLSQFSIQLFNFCEMRCRFWQWVNQEAGYSEWKRQLLKLESGC